jgi:hypothetical protein
VFRVVYLPPPILFRTRLIPGQQLPQFDPVIFARRSEARLISFLFTWTRRTRGLVYEVYIHLGLDLSSSCRVKWVDMKWRVTNDLNRGPTVSSLLDEPGRSIAALLGAKSVGQKPG